MKKKNWFEDHQGTIALWGVIIAMLALIYSFFSTRRNLVDIESEFKYSKDHQQKNDSLSRIKERHDSTINVKNDSERSVNYHNQDSMQRSTLKNFNQQSKIFSDQLANQTLGLKYSLKSNEPKIDILNFEKTDSVSGLQYFNVTFINSGNRSCKLNRVAFIIVNNEQGYDTTFLNTVNEQELNYRNNSTMRYFAPISVLNDKSTMYYYETAAIDNLTNKYINDKGYFKNPQFKNGVLGTEGLNDGELSLVNSYVNVSYYQNRDRLKAKSLNNEKFSQTSIFNKADNDLKTVLVATSKFPCKAGKADNCWKSTLSANRGDTIGVQIYFHNCGSFIARSVVLQMFPRINGFSKIHIMHGLIDEDNGILRDSATIITAKKTILRFIPGSVRIFKDQSTVGLGVKGEKFLFSDSGLAIGDIKPGWEGQGVLIANFEVYSKENSSLKLRTK